MDELLCKINDDSTFMLAAAISVVILLFIVLMVVISSMRIKVYKDQFINTKIDNQEKENSILSLQDELQKSQIKNVQNEHELQHFAKTRETLSETEEKLEKLRASTSALERLQSETRTELDHTIAIYEKLTDEHKTLLQKFETIQDDNTKLHINNARLLIKLESDARFASEMAKRSILSKKDENA